MSTLSVNEKLKLETMFGMKSGYVIEDTANKEFRSIISTATGKDIELEKYAIDGTSKANRLRAFWNIESDIPVGKVLHALLETWKTKRQLKNIAIAPQEQKLFDDCQIIANRLINGTSTKPAETEEDFIKREFKDLSIDKLGLDTGLTSVVSQRLSEIQKCIKAGAPLSVIFLCGSTLEGILLGTAIKHPQKFNQAKSAAKRDNKVLQLQEWSLASLIETAHELKILQEDVKKHSHSLRDFRNYIHPYQQSVSGFTPHEHTAKISWQVLQAAIYEISSFST